MSGRRPVIIVTGASKGIGLATTSILIRKFNANVVALSRSKTRELVQLEAESKALLVIECDVSNEDALRDAIALTEKTFGNIDGIILNAAKLEPLCRIGDETPLSAWKDHFDVNFFSLVVGVKAALPSLRKSELGGRIVMISSGAAVKGSPGWAPYAASKAAMNSLCRTLSEEELSVTSIAIRPGVVETSMTLLLREAGAEHLSPEAHDNFTKLHANGKLLKPEQPAHVIASLALHAPQTLSGQFVSWDDDACKQFREE